MRYIAYGHTLESAIPLRGLAAAAGGPAEISIRATTRPVRSAEAVASAHTNGSGPWLRIGKRPNSFVLHFDGGGTFTLSADASEITVHQDSGRLSDAVHHLLIDQVVPLALSHRGRLILHASGVVVDGHPIALFGPGGSGKSTLTASFGRLGSAVLADDALVLDTGRDGVTARPAYPGIRLWPDVLPMLGSSDAVPRVASYTQKRRLGAAHGFTFAEGDVRLRRMYLVQSDEVRQPLISPLSARQAAIAILTNTYLLDATNGVSLRRQLSAACALRGAVEIRGLSYPRDLARLPEVREAVRRDLAR